MWHCHAHCPQLRPFCCNANAACQYLSLFGCFCISFCCHLRFAMAMLQVAHVARCTRCSCLVIELETFCWRPATCSDNCNTPLPFPFPTPWLSCSYVTSTLHLNAHRCLCLLSLSPSLCLFLLTVCILLREFLSVIRAFGHSVQHQFF